MGSEKSIEVDSDAVAVETGYICVDGTKDYKEAPKIEEKGQPVNLAAMDGVRGIRQRVVAYLKH